MFRAALLLALSVVLLAASPARADLTVTGTQTLSPRLTQYTATSDALGRSTSIRVLLPAGYADGRSYPVLLLLHGCCDDYRSWVDKGRAEQLTAPYPADRRDARRRDERLVQRSVRRRDSEVRDVRVRRALPWVEATFAGPAAARSRA